MDNFENTVRAYWGDQLMRFDEKKMAHLNIGEETRNILMKIGLPDIAIESAMVFKAAKEPRQIELNDEKFIILGENVGDEDLGIFVCLKENTSEIWQVHTKYDKGIFFMNSDIKAFLLFLKTYSEFMLKGQGLSEDDFIQVESLVRDVKEKFLTIDPRALSESNCYWVLLLAELEI